MRSVAASHFGGDQVAMEKALAFFERDDSLQNVRSLRQVVAEGLDRFSGFFVPGGHAPIEDLAADPDLGEILRHAHAQGKPTAFLCHGPIAVLSAMPNSKAFERAMVDGDAAAASAAATGWQYSGYRMTIFSKSEERPVEANVLGGRLLYPVADALTAAGGLVENGPDYGSYVVTDRELITGQNPRSDRALAESLIAALDARPRG
jgi:putative intracellular protease/amidase